MDSYSQPCQDQLAHNAVVLFFSMNRYMSVGGAGRVCQQTFPSLSSCFCTESYMEAAKTEQEG